MTTAPFDPDAERAIQAALAGDALAVLHPLGAAVYDAVGNLMAAANAQIEQLEGELAAEADRFGNVADERDDACRRERELEACIARAVELMKDPDTSFDQLREALDVEAARRARRERLKARLAAR